MAPFDIKSLGDWITEVESAPTPLWLLEDLLAADSMIMVTGKAKRAFKTWLVFLMSMSASSGKSYGLLKPARPANGLIIEVEGARKPTANRFKMIERGTGLSLAQCPNLYMMHQQRFLLEDKHSIAQLGQFIKERNIQFIVLDTLVKLSRGDENDAREMTIALNGIEELRKHNQASAIYIHHTSKPGSHPKDIDDEIRGSSALAGAFDQHFAIRMAPQNPKELHMTVVSKDHEEKFFILSWHIDKHTQAAKLSIQQVTEFPEQEDDDTLEPSNNLKKRHWRDKR